MSVEPWGVLFDIDGTLTDTNYLHVVAWKRAFSDIGLNVSAASVHRLVGVGSDDLVEKLAGEPRDDVKEAWSKHFETMKNEIKAFPGAADLLRAVKERGGRVILASSSEEKDVDALLEALQASDVIDEVTSSGDVEEAKPSPEVFETALAKGGLSSARAIVVGDTVWDIEAATRCRLECVCVLTGGIGRAELDSAGAVAIYESVQELLEGLVDSPLARLST